MPEQEIASGIGCPTCWNNGAGVKSMLFARPGKFSYYCRTGHEFPDLQDLKDLNPPTLPIPQRQTQQQGHEPVHLLLPTDLKQALLQKFGSPEKLQQTLAGVLRVLAEKQCFLVNEEDIERIEKMSGHKPKTGAELVGVMFQKDEKIKELTAQLGSPAGGAAPAAAPGVPEGKLLIDANLFLPQLRGLANFRNETPEQVATQTLKMALDNGWA